MRFTFLLAGVSLSMAAACSHAEVVRLGSLSLDWPAGTTVKSTKPPFELVGPDGAKVLVTVMRPPPGADLVKAQAMTEQLLISTAQKAGKPTVPFGKDALTDGSVLQFIGSEVSKLLRTGYFLQYALLAPDGQMAYLTAEGSGDGAGVHERVKGVLRTAQWQGSAGTAAERVAFTERVAGLFRAQLSGANVVVAEPLTLKIGDLQANLDRVYDFCRRNADGCGAELDVFVRTVKDMQGGTELPLAREAVRVVVRTADYVKAIQQTAQQAETPAKVHDSEPLPLSIVDGLFALPVLDAPGSLRMLNRGNAEALGLSPAQAHALGLANLRATLKPLADVAPPVMPGQIGRVAGDVYETSRLLLQADWAALGKAQAGTLVVALPTTTTLLYGADASAAGLDALQTLANDMAQRAPNRLSPLLLRWTEAGWQIAR